MSQENINVGATGNDGTGDDLRTAGTKINNNFSEVYGDISVLQAISGVGVSGISFDSGGLRFEGSTADSNETLLLATDPTADRTVFVPDASGTLALTSDITSTIDSAYVSLITGTAFDSGSTRILIAEDALDSDKAIALIDSAYVQLRQITATFDSAEVTQMIDSNYVKGFADNNYVLGFVDAAHINSVVNILDSAQILGIADSSQLDSSDVIQLIDSSYTQTRVDKVNLRNYSVATSPNAGDTPHGNLIFVTDGNSGAACLGIYDSDAGYYRRIALGAQIST